MARGSTTRSKVLRLAAERMSIAEIVRRTGLPRSTCYRWISQHDHGYFPKNGRPESITLAFSTRALRQILALNFSETIDGRNLWTWKSLASIIPLPRISRQSTIRFLQHCSIHPNSELPRFEQLGISTRKTSKKSRRTTYYLLELCVWEKPEWMPVTELPQYRPVLWRLRSQRSEYTSGSPTITRKRRIPVS